jgi:hypothetical protein
MRTGLARSGYRPANWEMTEAHDHQGVVKALGRRSTLHVHKWVTVRRVSG